MCRLLALKANDEGTDPEQLVREIYDIAATLKDELDDDKRLLLEQWVMTYKKISNDVHTQIKKEYDMDYPATTISEHFRLEGKEEGLVEGEEKGWIKGHAEGRVEGRVEGEIRGEIKILEVLHEEGLLSDLEFERHIIPLRQKLAELLENEFVS